MVEKSATERADVRSLDEVLPGFTVTIARTVNEDRLLAYSTSEPWFCFERATEEEIQAVVSETIRFYLATFRQMEHVEVKLEIRPLAPEVPVERLKPTSKVLTTLFEGDLQMATG